MELKKITTALLLLGGGILFNFLFWEEQIGLNLMLFSAFLIVIGFVTQPRLLKSQGALTSLFGILLTGGMVIVHNSMAARIVHYISIFLFVGFLCEPLLKTNFHALTAAVLNATELPKSLFNAFFQKNKKAVKWKKRWRRIRLIVIPIIIFWIFYAIFYASNPIFAGYSDTIWDSFADALEMLFEDISFPWILLLFVGMFLTGWVLFQSTPYNLTAYENDLQDTIQRRRKPLSQMNLLQKVTLVSLKNEYKSAMLLIASINTLLLVVNSIDIHWIWFNFKYDGIMNLSQLVHEGTYLLILSILLSMGILLYFFRRNLNFFPDNLWLRRLANIWIIQNTVLVISVVIRNYHYMYHFGLAYKRIGVMFFLTAVIIGLITLYIKINKTKTTFYLLRINSWAVYGLFLLLSTVNWDIVIVKHNIRYTQEKNLDVQFLLSLSDKALPIIHQNRHRLDLEKRSNYDGELLEHKLDRRIANFLEEQEDLTWKSWNFSDSKAYEYFKSTQGD